MTRDKTSSEYHAHLAAIEKIKDRWLSGEISTAEKREQIAAENSFWYGRTRKSPVTGEILTRTTGDITHIPGDAARTPPVTQPPTWDDDEQGEPWWQR